MEQPGFLKEFTDKMDALTKIKKDVAQSIASKEQFTGQLKDRLRQINDRLRELAWFINDLKNKTSHLDRQVGTNNAAISERQGQLDTLTAERDRIARERAQLEKEKGETQAKCDNFQFRIDELEGQLRDVKAAAEQREQLLSQEVEAFKNELNSKGDQQSAHAQAIANLTKKSETQLAASQGQLEALQKQLTELQESETRLKQQIEGYEEQMKQHAATLKQKDDKLTALNAEQTECQAEIGRLNGEIEALKAQNKDLVDKLTAATQAIHEATELLNGLINSMPNGASQKEINDLLILIEKSIENISNVAQGRTTNEEVHSTNASAAPLPNGENTGQQLSAVTKAATQFVGNTVSQARKNVNNINNPTDNPSKELIDSADYVRNKLSPAKIQELSSRMSMKLYELFKIRSDTYIDIKDIDGRTSKFEFFEIIRKLVGAIGTYSDEKYKNALAELTDVKDANKVDEILKKYDILLDGRGNIVNERKKRGGRKTRKISKISKARKTRKNIKQKGGFIYKTNSKRRTSRRTSRRTTTTATSSRNKTSSRRSSVSSR
jgi:chromosome segregation ATPase